jgi:hypothetical protein
MVRWPRFSPLWRAGLAAAVLLAGAVGTAPAVADPVPQHAPSGTAATPRPEDPVAHDPTMVKEGDWYYLVITGDAGRAGTFLPVKRSKDLVHWTELSPVFSTWVCRRRTPPRTCGRRT